MCATQVLPETLTDDSAEESESEIIGCIIVDNKKYELRKGETKIGRDSAMCSIVIENYTISKVHAVIESDGVDDTFIYDVGSTNQTKLGKKILKPHCRYKLDNDSKLTLGNVSAKFVIPPDKTSDYNSQTPKSGNFDPLNELGDIFDIPTQVSYVQSTSTKVSTFEKLPENFKIFKIPHPVTAAKPSTLSKSCFEEDTQAVSSQMKQRTVFFADSFDNSGIFSLGTQCQLYEAPAEQEKTSAVQTVGGDSNKNGDKEKIKSLLNDGHDDVLCTFMSLHAPDEPSGLVNEINIKTELKGLTQVFDASTQAQVESIEERERKELSEILQDKDLTEDFTMSTKPSVTSTPVNNKFVHPGSVFKKNKTRIIEEDLIQTQEFNCEESRKGAKEGNSSQDDETQPYLDETIDCTQPNEDLILTQTFEAIERNLQNKETTSMVVPETEDFLETQLYEVEDEIRKGAEKLPEAPHKDFQSKETPMVVMETEDFLETQIFPVEKETRTEARVLPETPDRDLDTSFTHRNDEDDFIATQVFEKPPSVRSDEKSDKDDEDFISTQKVEFPVIGSLNTRVAGTTCRESSPDLLVSDSFAKDYEDCISTQIFEAPACQNVVRIGTSQQISSHKKENECSVTENSGDETESDLEILLDETTKNNGPLCPKFIKPEQPDSNPQTSQNDNSNSSYIFELEPENPSERTTEQKQSAELSDSDATDCEEITMISPKIQLKEEPKEKMEFEDTQVLTLTPADNFAEQTSVPDNDWMTGGAESPKFGCESPLSLEMPNTQEIETTVNRILRNETEKEDPKKIEVGIANGVVTLSSGVDSPLKRPRNSSSGEVVPVKKSKTETTDRNSEIRLSKLVQAHDIAQIQPSRTRNSLKKENKNGVSQLGNNINEHPTSRRRGNAKKGNTKNPNGDITPYLTRKVERKLSYGGRQKETPLSEKQPVEGSSSSRRVLRSSARNATPTNPPNTSTRKSKRNSRANEYFSGSCVNVVFTGFDWQVLEKIISDLGGKKTNELTSGDVVVTDKVCRTVKFLSAIGLGLPIASPEWLLSCKNEKKFLNPWNFILKDEESEEKWNFDLKASLDKSKKRKLLQGFSIFATKSTRPPVKDLLAIVEFCGGTPLFDQPDVWPKKTIVVSCLEDQKWWPPAKLRHVKVVHYEFILTGVLRQKIDFKAHKLR